MKRISSSAPAAALRGLALLVAALLLSAAALAADAPKDDPKKDLPVLEENYRLMPGDEVTVTVFPQEKYSSVGIVLPDGKLFLKAVGALKAKGMTVAEVQKAVFKRLDEDQGLLNPDVTVQITKIHPPDPIVPPDMIHVTVVGAVSKPGAVDVEKGTRVRKVIDLAGGSTKDADLTKVIIYHKDQTNTQVNLSKLELVTSAAHNRVLDDGDSIEISFVPERVVPTARIRGQVMKPTRYEIKEAGELQDLIGDAGGLLPTADYKHARLERKGSPVETVDLEQMLKKGRRILLQPGDDVFIPELENTIVVFGAVPVPGPKAYTPGQRISELIKSPDFVASIQPQVQDLNNVQIYRPGEPALKVKIQDLLDEKKRKPENDVVLRNGDSIYFPAKAEPKQKINPLAYLGTLATLFAVF